ncbi:MAG: carbon monoxide dehydrogenase subunit G [Acidobacteriaceae bacterium]|nr:carbon monoxide dehydrogenase subunit G [Acidobacteriaceae bacterium]
MNIEGSRDFAAPAESVYRALTDPAVLCKCIPGCEKLEPVADNTFEAVLAVGVGSLKGRFNGRVTLQDTVPPTHYRIVFEGKGGPGFAKGNAEFNLSGADGQTSLHYVANVSVGGPLAGVAQRLIHSTAHMLAGRFFAALEKNGLGLGVGT